MQEARVRTLIDAQNSINYLAKASSLRVGVWKTSSGSSMTKSRCTRWMPSPLNAFTSRKTNVSILRRRMVRNVMCAQKKSHRRFDEKKIVKKSRTSNWPQFYAVAELRCVRVSSKHTSTRASGSFGKIAADEPFNDVFNEAAELRPRKVNTRTQKWGVSPFAVSSLGWVCNFEGFLRGGGRCGWICGSVNQCKEI